MRPVEEYNVRLGAKINALKTEHGLTTSELARRTGLVRPVVDRILRGQRRANVDHLVMIARALSIEPAEMLPCLFQKTDHESMTIKTALATVRDSVNGLDIAIRNFKKQEQG